MSAQPDGDRQPTADEWVARFLAGTTEERVAMAERALRNQAAAHRCFVMNHDGEVEHLRTRVQARTAPETEARAAALLEARDEIRTEARYQLMQVASDRATDSIGRLEVLDKILTDRAAMIRERA